MAESMQSRNVTRAGFAITAIYLLLLATYSAIVWNNLLKMTPNEFGDYLAGVLGPLALFWLVCGYFQQGIELRQNTEALRLQAEELHHSTQALELQVDELKNSVEQQTRLARLTADQLDLNVRATQRAEDVELARNEPRFDITKFERYSDQAPAIGEVKVINSGARVVITKMESNHKDDKLGARDDWDTGVVLVFMPFRRGAEDRQTVEIRVRFRQENGISRDMLLTMRLEDGARYSDPEIEVVAQPV